MADIGMIFLFKKNKTKLNKKRNKKNKIKEKNVYIITYIRFLILLIL